MRMNRVEMASVVVSIANGRRIREQVRIRGASVRVRRVDDKAIDVSMVMGIRLLIHWKMKKSYGYLKSMPGNIHGEMWRQRTRRRKGGIKRSYKHVNPR